MANLNFNGIIRGGVLRNMQILGFGANPTPPGPSPLQVSGSVRLNPADTPSFSYVPSLTGSPQTLTFSAWIKRSLLGSQQILFGTNTDANNHGFLEFQSNDTIRIASNSSASTVIQLITTQVFRDPSQWYHLLLAFDLTNATQADRVQLYINGSRVTAFSTSTLPANTTTITTFNTAGVQQYIGRYVASSSFYFGGYIADINLVDGQALTPAAFTETDSDTGQLIPMTYSGSYGINGFYLPFGNSATVAELGFNTKTTAQDYPYWPYNSLLVNSSSTNGAQNNTFLDSSTNNFTITRNGNTTQGRFGPFEPGGGTEQTAGYYSGYFDGSGDYINLADSSAFALGTNNFTIEAWVFAQNSASTSMWFNQWENSASSDVNSSFVLSITSSKFQGAVAYGGSTSQVTLAGATTVQNNQWYHVALVRNGSSLTLYVNGRSENTSTTLGASSVNNSNLGLYIGTRRDATLPFQGYISNARLVNGTALYTSNFTVPTTPLTAVTNTALLTCQSSLFTDNSTNAFAITTAGQAQPVPANPFGMTDWSGYFDGTGDYLSVADSAVLDLNTTFTVEAWFYKPTATDGVILGRGGGVASWSTTNGHEYILSVLSGTLYWQFNTSGVVTSLSTTVQTERWNHVAVGYNGTTTRVWLNGVSVATSTNSYTLPTTRSTTRIGYNASSEAAFPGWISNLRIVKGTDVYGVANTSITVPTAPLTAVTNTSLLTCQSSTFVDNSTNALAITVNGNSYTSTLNNPFNSPVNYTTPPAQTWSNYFNGSSQLQVSTTNSAFDIAGDFTVEGWFNVAAGGYQFFGVEQAASPEYAAIQLQLNSDKLNLLMSQSGSAWAVNSTSTQPYPANQWSHMAVTRNGTAVRLFLNGKVIISTTLSGALYSSGVRTCINGRNAAGYVTGWFSNFRFINGQALYTTDFTPSTEPLTLTSQGAQASLVKLLTCQSNRFVDNSLFQWPLVIGGTPQIQTVSPYFPTTAWTAANNGGSMYFDGTGDYLSIPKDSSLASPGDFTFQAWIYPTSTNTGTLCGFGVNQPNGYSALNWRITSTTMQTYWSTNGSSETTISGGTIVQNVWQHVAATRSGTTIRIFLNGIQVGSGTVSGALYTGSASTGGANSYTVGCYFSSNAASVLFTGYIANFEYINGTALYTTSFVPPVLPTTVVANTKLLLNATNAGIYDATGVNNIETVGNAQASTAVKKWGESSVYFDGSGDYLVVPPKAELYLSGSQTAATNKDFTLECWIYPTTISYPNTYAAIATKRGSTGSASGYILSVNSSGALSYAAGDSNTAGWEVNFSSSNGAIAANNWYHVAVTRRGTTFRMFINGTQVATATPTAFVIAYDITGSLFIGLNAGESPLYPWYGYMQDFRYTVGAARYQGAFTPPTAAFAYNQYDICNQQWTPTNLSVTAGAGQDNLVDSPSDYGTDTGVGGQVKGNYSTWNPLSGIANGTLSNGNLDFVGVANGSSLRHATMGIASGKWYAEITVTSALSSAANLGIALYSQSAIGTVNASQSRGYYYDGQKYSNGTLSAYGNSYTNGDIIGIAVDADSGKVWFSKNGTWQNSGSPTAGTNAAFTDITGTTWFISIQTGGSTGSAACSVNFGQRAFAYTAPTDFKCLVSTNLPTPSIGASASTQASDYFNPVLYTGTGASLSVTGVGFQPDLTWIKGRSGATNNSLYDAVRGVQKQLESNTTTAETTQTTGLTTFGSDGFTVGSLAQLNTNTATYVAWNWNAGGSTVTNTAGTISAQVRANTTNGVSVVTYTSQSSGSGTIGHGLGVAPAMIINKPLTGSFGWSVYHQSTGNLGALVLNTNGALTNSATYWNTTSPTTTVFSQGSAFAGLGTMVAYCFASVPGFSSLGSFTSIAAADNAFVYTGFAPRFIMIKIAAVGLTGNWIIYDTARNPTNIVGFEIYPNSSAAEVNSADLDILSNGFKLRNAGFGSGNYIYAAFAEFPFKYARAR